MKEKVTMRVLVTGGSGFIGTNMVEFLLNAGQEVLSIDIKDPQTKDHVKVFKWLDILDLDSLIYIINDFSPTHVIHLAARTDLHEKKNIEGYSVNIKGVENIVNAISNQSSVEKCIFVSTKLVSPTDYTPKTDNDYCPNTLYGKSKVEGEKIVCNAKTLQCSWCIVRPTSIWGPWSLLPHIPYGKFFQTIAKGLYFHPCKVDSPKSFGYVGNTVFQISKLLTAHGEQIHKKVLYLSDYDIFMIKDWADVISMKLNGKTVKTIPKPLVHILAWGGDVMKLFGIKEPLFSSFRLKNMRADTSKIPLEVIKRITGALPYTMEQGVDETIAWLKMQSFIK